MLLKQNHRTTNMTLKSGNFSFFLYKTLVKFLQKEKLKIENLKKEVIF
jgi:hypothetical protein